MRKFNTRKLYNLPGEVRYCKKCTISNQRPRIKFDENGICFPCKYNEYKRHEVDWNRRDQELTDLCNKNRSKNGDFDVVVPCSGGKDGSYVAHQLKAIYGMNPLCVTWSPLIPTEIGRKNLNAFIQSGFNHLLGSPNPDVSRRLANICLKEMGDPFQPFIYGQYNFPLKVALQNNIKLIFYGENGEVEYGGDMKNAYRATRDLSDVDKHYFSGLPPSFWREQGFSESDLFPYLSPSFKSLEQAGIEVHFMGYYKFWDPQENFYYAMKNTGFSPAPERSEGTYSRYASLDDKLDAFHYYLMFIKFGIGRATSDSAHEIRDQKITREEGMILVKQYDSEFPLRNIDSLLEYCSITKEELTEIIDAWRPDHLWRKSSESSWELIHPIWKQ